MTLKTRCNFPSVPCRLLSYVVVYLIQINEDEFLLPPHAELFRPQNGFLPSVHADCKRVGYSFCSL